MHRDFALFSDISTNYNGQFFFYIWELPVFALMGALGGLIGAAFVLSNIQVTRLRHRFIPTTRPALRFLETLALAALTATVTILVTYAGPCKPVPEIVASNEAVVASAAEGLPGADGAALLFTGAAATLDEFFPRLWCEDGKYSTFGQLLMVRLPRALQLLVHASQPDAVDRGYAFLFSVPAMTVFMVLVLLLMVITFGVAAPTGLFVPALVSNPMGLFVSALVSDPTGLFVPAMVPGSGGRQSLSWSSSWCTHPPTSTGPLL